MHVRDYRVRKDKTELCTQVVVVVERESQSVSGILKGGRRQTGRVGSTSVEVINESHNRLSLVGRSLARSLISLARKEQLGKQLPRMDLRESTSS